MTDETTIDMQSGIYRRVYACATKGRRINSVSIFAEWLFWRLHLVGDDFGTFEAEPYLIQIQAAPMRREVTEEQISDALRELEQKNLISTFEAGGERYGRISDFERFQPAGRNGRRIRRFPAGPEIIQGNPGESSVSRGIQGNPGETSDSVSAHTDTEEEKKKREGNPADSRPAKPRKQATGPQADLIRHFTAAWERQYGAEYVFRAKDGKAAADVLKAASADLPAAKAIIDRYFRCTDKFFADAHHPLPLLASQINRFTSGNGHAASSGGSLTRTVIHGEV